MRFEICDFTAAVGQMITAPKRCEARRRGGKSELRRAVRRVTPGQGNLKESGTENIPPAFARFACYGVAGPVRELVSPKASKGEKVR